MEKSAKQELAEVAARVDANPEAREWAVARVDQVCRTLLESCAALERKLAVAQAAVRDAESNAAMAVAFSEYTDVLEKLSKVTVTLAAAKVFWPR